MTEILRKRPRQDSDYLRWVLWGVVAATPGVAMAAWFTLWALHVPPRGGAGPVLAFVLSAIFGILNLFLAFLTAVGSRPNYKPVRHPVAYLTRTIFAMLLGMFWLYLPLAICIGVVKLAVTAMLH
jgi:hypothetical protein